MSMLRTVSLLSCGVALCAGSCQDNKDCGSCVNSETLWTHTCYWCEINQACHTVGSLTSPCAPDLANNQCITKSSYSTCTKSSINDCNEDSATAPQQIHISLAGPDGMRVAWKTNLNPKVAVVKFSTDFTKDAGATVHAERSVQYLSSQGGHGYHHAAKLTGLAPGTQYQYRIECDGVTSTMRSFKTAANGQTEAKFLFVADMGFKQNGNAIATRSRLDALKGSTDMTIIAGDIAYADDSFIHGGECAYKFCYETVYDGYMQDMENVMDNKPFMTVVGNHEGECHSPGCLAGSVITNSLRNFSAYNARFAMPSAESGGAANMWYSFDYASVHFVMVNTETDFSGAEQENFGDSCGPSGGVNCLPAGHFAPEGQYLKWLEADLKAANASRSAEQPWVVAVGHRPWVFGGVKAGNGLVTTDEAVKTAHAALFEKYGVDLYMTGHQHSYHRLRPINGNKATPIVVTGGAGCDEFLSDRESLGTRDVSGSTDDWDYYFMNTDTQVGILEATASTLTWKAIASSTGKVFDTLVLNKALEGSTEILL